MDGPRLDGAIGHRGTGTATGRLTVVQGVGVLPGPADPTERAEWTSELVYGTLTVLITIAGLEVAGGARPEGAGAIILVGALGTAVAHAYSRVLGYRAAHGRRAPTGQIRHALRQSSTIVVAAIPAVIAFGGASLGVWSSGGAMAFSNGAGIAVLAAAGWIAARAVGAPVVGQITSVIVTASIGLGIVAVELLLLH